MVLFRPYRPLRLLAALLAGLVPGAVQAQCLLCSDTDSASTDTTASARDDREGLEPLRVSITADLDFARVVTDGSGGSVTIDPVTGQSRSDGSASTIGGSGFTGHAVVQGSAGRAVRIQLPAEVRLTSTSGGEARISNIVSSLPPRAQIGADGRLEFSFGGRLELDGQTDGDFRGRIQITVSYE